MKTFRIKIKKFDHKISLFSTSPEEFMEFKI